MKKKVLLTSIISIACCASLIKGATFELFTSESKVNIAVTSGKVDVKATIDETSVETYSGQWNETTKVYDSVKQAEAGVFVNGGTAVIDGSTLTLDKMTPMDKATFKIGITNNSNVAFKQRISLFCADADKGFYDQLLVGLSDDGINYTYYGDYATAWETGTAVTEGPQMTYKYMSIELPEYVGNEWQGKTCNISVSVEAIQGNAATTGDAAASLVYLAKDQTELTAALGTMSDGDTVVLSGGEWAAAEISFSEAKAVKVRGYKVGTMTINAPNGSVALYCEAETLNVEAVASNTLHVYGKVNALTLKQGRAVLETGARVASVSVVPSEYAVAKAEIKPEATVSAVATVPGVNAVAMVSIGENVTVPVFTHGGQGETKLDNSGVIETTSGEGMLTEGIVTAESLLAHFAKGGTIDLAADIQTDGQLVVPEGQSVILNLGSYDIKGSYAGYMIVNNGTMTINGSEDACVYTTDVAAQGRGAVLNNGTMTINGGTFGDKDTDRTNANDVQRGNAVRNYGAMTINGGYFTACDNYTNGGYAYAIGNGSAVAPHASMTIKNAVVYGKMNGVLAADGGTMTVKGGTYTLGVGTNANLFHMAYTSGSGRVVIDGGNFTRNEANTNAFFNGAGEGTITVNGGTFNDLINSNIIRAGNVCINGGIFTDVEKKNAYVATKEAFTALILQSYALTNGLEDITITLVADFAINPKSANKDHDGYLFLKNSVLDLNGKTLTVETNNAFMVVGTNITVKNGTIKAANETIAYPVAATANSQNVVFEDIVCIGGIQVLGNSTVTLRNVTSTATLYYNVYVAGGNATATIEGGTFTDNGKAHFYIDESTPNGKIIVKSGEFSGGEPTKIGGGTVEIVK